MTRRGFSREYDKKEFNVWSAGWSEREGRPEGDAHLEEEEKERKREKKERKREKKHKKREKRRQRKKIRGHIGGNAISGRL